MKPFFAQLVKYVRLILIFVVVASVGVLMGEKGVTQKQKLEEKLSLLQKENERLAREIKVLERNVTLLRTDPRTIEKVAKRKLGMASADESVYIFQQDNSSQAMAETSETGLAKGANIP